MYKKSKHLAVDMLPKNFKGSKCKTSLKLAMSRIKLMRNKREMQVKQMRRDLAQLLEAGQDQTARIRVEHVIREEKTLSAYELIDIYCELIVARLPIIESQKSCPIDLKEAIASVVFASPRCADIPELMEVRKQFLSKYGKEFITSALEVRPECGVSRLLVEKLSARAPDGETKVKVMTSIAQEHNVKWEHKSFEDQLNKPNEDLLAGPNTFASVNQMSVKSSNISAMPSSMNEPSTRMFQSDAPSKATSYNSSSGPSINTPSTSVPSVMKSNSMVSENREGRSTLQEVNSANHVENGSLNRQNWNMEFKDASSAAQAAAESAERASMAARAAAELARRGSASYNMKDGSEKSECAQAKDEYVIKESVPMQYNEMKPSQGMMQMKMDRRKIDEVPQASSRREAKETYDGHADIPRSSSQPIYHSNEISGRSDHLEINQKVDGRTPDLAQRSISKSEPLVQNYEDNQNEYADYVEEYADYEEEIINENYNKSAGRSSFDDDTGWDSNTWKHANHEEKSGIGAGQGSFGNSPPIIFDDYGFDTDDRLLDTFSSQQEEEQSTYLPSKDQWSSKEHRSSFVDEGRSSQQMFERTEPHSTEFVETTEKEYQSPNFDVNTSAAFDDYDGHSYEDEDVFDKIMSEEAMEPSNLPFDQKHSSKSLLSAGPSREANQSYSFQNKEVEEASENHVSSVPSDGSEKIHEAELGSHDRKWKQSSSSSLSTNKSLHDENASGHSINSEKEIFYIVADEKPKTSGPSRVPSLEAKSNDAVRMSALSLDTDDSPDDSGAGLKLGKLTGGFKHKGFPRPPYHKGPLPNNLAPSKQSSVASPATEIPVSSQEKPTTSFNSSYQEEYDQEQNPQAYMSKSRASSVHSDFNKEKSSELSYTEGRGCTNDGPSLANYGRDASNIERETVSYQEKESPNTEYKVYKSYNPRAPKQDHRQYGSESYSIPDFPSIPEKTFADPETPKQEVSNQIRVSKTNKESRSNMPFNYSDQDADKVETLEPRHTLSNRVDKNVKLSRRTRALPSEGKRGNLSTFTGQSIAASEMESQPSQSNFTSKPPSTNNTGIYLERRGSSESSQPKLSAEQPPVIHKAEPSKNKEMPKSSSEPAFVDSSGSAKKSSSMEGSSSSNDSLKKAPHVHPRLPDYDSFAAHFQSLRANRQPQ